MPTRLAKSSFRKTVQNVSLAFAFNGIGVPAAVTSLLHSVVAMIAMAASVTAVLVNSFAGRLLPHRGTEKETIMETMNLTIPTMHCEGCLNNIRRALEALPTVQEVEGNVQDKQVTVTLQDPNVSRDEICGAIFQIGHACGESLSA